MIAQAVGALEITRGAGSFPLGGDALNLLGGLYLPALEQAFEAECVEHLVESAGTKTLAGVEPPVGLGHPLEQRRHGRRGQLVDST